MKTTTIYNYAFWNAMRGKQITMAEMKEGSDNSGGYILPSDFNDKYLKALEKENVFRRLATVVDTTSAEGKIHAVTSTGAASWVKAMAPIPESADSFKRFTVNSYKLASIAKIKTNFIEDNNFNLESYLENQFSRRFGRSEENAFINGNGIDEPTGILNYY